MCVCVCVCVFSEEDEEEPLDWLPIAPEIEEPEDTGWGQLEVSILINPRRACAARVTVVVLCVSE